MSFEHCDISYFLHSTDLVNSEKNNSISLWFIIIYANKNWSAVCKMEQITEKPRSTIPRIFIFTNMISHVEYQVFKDYYAILVSFNLSITGSVLCRMKCNLMSGWCSLVWRVKLSPSISANKLSPSPAANNQSNIFHSNIHQTECSSHLWHKSCNHYYRVKSQFSALHSVKVSNCITFKLNIIWVLLQQVPIINIIFDDQG